MTPSLFPDLIFNFPATEGVKYAGSKLKLLPYILQLAHKVKPKTVFDGFAGTTRVSQAFAQLGYKVISNDIAVWSKIFGLCYLKNKRDDKFYQEIINHLNALPEKDGWFTENYGGVSNGKSSSETDGFKKPWQIHNTRRLDAIREEIDNLSLGEIEKAVVLTSLVLALDKVDSTLGHFSSYLKEWSPRSFNRMNLKVPRLFESPKEHEVLSGDIFKTIEKVEADLAYFDPPYGSNNEKMPPSRVRYAAYYHLWTTIVLNDQPKIFGKAKRRCDTSDTLASSVFEEFRRSDSGKFMAVEAIEKLITKTNAKHIILSYSSSGKATAEELYEILSQSGKILDFVKVDYKKNVMAAMCWTNEWTQEIEKDNQELLFLIER
ncbi:MAG: DNA adenine methylase [Pyrinomonadaceae bacterium]|nr:DNA adenine methylase [Pyrinomonadaceae bacterium]